MICEAPAGDGGSLLCISLGVFAAEFEKSAINVGCPEGAFVEESSVALDEVRASIEAFLDVASGGDSTNRDNGDGVTKLLFEQA